MTGGHDGEAFERALVALRGGLADIVDEIVPVDVGFAARTRSLPEVWTLNQLCITAPAKVEEVVALAEEHQRDLGFRHVVVEHEPTAAALTEPLGAAGWRVETLQFMVFREQPPGPLDASAVVELAEEEMLALMRSWLLETRPDIGDDALDQVAEYNRREGRRWNEVAHGVRDGDGTPVAVTKVRHDDGALWWVEDVYTLPSARRRGLARTLVTHAVRTARTAGAELVFIIADADDWPQHLYASIGFRPLGTVRTFHVDSAS